jgi:small-conductance mechanosensitive channel
MAVRFTARWAEGGATMTEGSTDRAADADELAVTVDVSAEERRAAHHRREQLHQALIELEQALTAPTSRDRWLRDLAHAARQTRETVLDHVAESEAPEGLLAQIAEVSPWLGPRVTQLRGEHDHLVARCDALMSACTATATPEDVTDQAWELLERISRHRQRGADLLYDAYALDVSAGD